MTRYLTVLLLAFGFAVQPAIAQEESVNPASRAYAPEPIERLTNARCVAGRDWGFDHRRGLWVNNGCATRFGVRE